MLPSRKVSRWWRKFLGVSASRHDDVVAGLFDRYNDEQFHAARFRQHAQKMQYPQFRDKLLQIAEEEDRHAAWIAEQISMLGERLPQTVKVVTDEINSWQCLLADLDAEQRCAADLERQIWEMNPEFVGVAEVLKRIREDGKRHRGAIREMLMRSDPQAVWPA